VNNEFHDKYSLSDTKMIKLGWMRWMGHVAYLGDMRNVFKI
jgi:hypothetical protein